MDEKSTFQRISSNERVYGSDMVRNTRTSHRRPQFGDIHEKNLRYSVSLRCMQALGFIFGMVLII